MCVLLTWTLAAGSAAERDGRLRSGIRGVGLRRAMDNPIEQARIGNVTNLPFLTGMSEQPFVPSVSPEDFCRQIGLNWMAALDLQRQDLLSFDLRSTNHLNASQEAELKFLGRLVAAGCCNSVLRVLLSGLRRPYAYNLDRIYYDWSGQQWRLLEDTEHIESRFDEWLDELINMNDRAILQRLHDHIEGALELMAGRPRQRLSERFVPD
jgi:hypothetical protein